MGLELATDLPTWTVADRLDELAELVKSAGGEVVGRSWQRRDRPEAATLIGPGKVEEVREACLAHDVTLVVFDHELSPGQLRNLEELLGEGVRVLDRTQVILDIFAQRARTREGKLQVELAQLEYLLPRLSGMGEALSRLGGGIGTRGPGETKLEADRRRVRHRIVAIKRELEGVRAHRARQREARKRVGVPVVALVGYTNAGKSTLMNALTSAQVLSANALFATLDPTTRRLVLPNNREAVLSDTVGFVHDLPHHLVAAFRATLEEVAEAQVLLHVVDASQRKAAEHMEAVRGVLREIGAEGKRTIVLLNKADLGLFDALPLAPGERTVTVSALTGQGLDDLLDAIASALEQAPVRLAVEVPYSRAELVDLLHRRARVLTERYDEVGIHLEVECRPDLARRVQLALGLEANAPE